MTTSCCFSSPNPQITQKKIILIILLLVCSGQLRMYFPGISENDENHATDLCGHIPENLTMLVIDKVLNLRASGFGYQRYAEEYRNGTKFLIDYEAVKGEITTVTGKV